MTFDFKDLNEAVRMYTSEKRWRTHRGLWCCQFHTLCVVVETYQYLPINVGAIGLTTKYSTAGQLTAEIEEALWQVCPTKDLDMLGFDTEVYYRGFDLLMSWSRETRLLFDPFVSCHSKDGAIAVELTNIHYL